ncbi:MAG: universal stress protein [Paracoccaceae bacterium]|nr:universal stress protein [Paracoccaceae bacterium]
MSKPINTILCAVDVTRDEVDRAVLERAAKLAALEGAQLDVITVMPDFGMPIVAGYFREGFHDKALLEARSRLNEFVESVLGADENSKIRHVVATGSIYEEILKAATRDEADLIVIGAHRPDIADFLLGPNAARVVRHAKCSVYVVR